MTLRLYLHPFSSYCQKALIAFYERDVPFEPVNIEHEGAMARLAALWPFGKFPVLEDEERGKAFGEASIIVEYLDLRHPGPPPLVPRAAEAALEVRLLDRVFDLHVHTPLQKVIGDLLRPEGERDAQGVAEARELARRAYAILDERLARNGGPWAAGEAFTLADCAAAPALFYAGMIEPFEAHPTLDAYYRRLRARPSFARAVDEARPYRGYFPPGWREGWD